MPRTEYPETKPDDPMDTFDKGLTLAARLVFALAAVVAVGALVFILLAPTAQAASEIGTPATITAPASHRLLARAGKLVLRDVKAKVAETLAAGGGTSATYSKAVCHGTTKRIVCVATSIQTEAAPYTEVVLVRRGKLIGQGAIATTGGS
jgi:hypothetical protein